MNRLPKEARKLSLPVRTAAALEVLADRERQVLSLLLLERLTMLETSAALNLTVKQVERSFSAGILSIERELGIAHRTRRVA
ncbi:MAG: sigma factor-like helix-turn-helix DNA-binding protein [Candidatus Eisenbacteria bacterium]